MIHLRRLLLLHCGLLRPLRPLMQGSNEGEKMNRLRQGRGRGPRGGPLPQREGLLPQQEGWPPPVWPLQPLGGGLLAGGGPLPQQEGPGWLKAHQLKAGLACGLKADPAAPTGGLKANPAGGQKADPAGGSTEIRISRAWAEKGPAISPILPWYGLRASQGRSRPATAATAGQGRGDVRPIVHNDPLTSWSSQGRLRRSRRLQERGRSPPKSQQVVDRSVKRRPARAGQGRLREGTFAPIVLDRWVKSGPAWAGHSRPQPTRLCPGPSTARGKSLYNAWSVFSGSLEAPQDSLGCSHHSPACKEAHYEPNNMRGYCFQSSFLPGRISLHSFSPRIR